MSDGANMLGSPIHCRREVRWTGTVTAWNDRLGACASVGTPVSRVGTVTAEPDIEIIMPDGSIVGPPAGYTHFG